MGLVLTLLGSRVLHGCPLAWGAHIPEDAFAVMADWCGDLVLSAQQQPAQGCRLNRQV